MFLELTILSALLSSVTATASQWKISPPLLVEEVSSSTFKGWEVQLHSSWDVLGPFPQQAREQHFISPSYPLDLSHGWHVDWNEEYISPLADGGVVRWSHTDATDGNLDVMFPEVRWQQLRSTEGWAALQHHAVLHSYLTVTPPDEYDGDPLLVPTLIADVRSASYFSIIPDERNVDHSPQWHAGNIYNLPNTPSQAIQLPTTPKARNSTTYHLIASGDYEIRLFGDPVDIEGQQTPIQKLQFNFKFLENDASPLVLEPQMDVIPEFVGGWTLAAEGALGIGVKAIDGWWEVVDISSSSSEFKASLESKLFRLSPHQSRVIPIRLQQQDSFLGESVFLSIKFKRRKMGHVKEIIKTTFTLNVSISAYHKRPWNDSDREHVYKASYFLGGTPLWFMVKPPFHKNPESPAIIALHGSGVEADSSVWTQAVPRQNSSWVIYPTGRTSWGYDWHGPSALDVWASHDALRSLISSHDEWRAWSIHESRVILLGHSNGGQGVWYQASRFPDRVLAAVPAAAYIKSQLYISTSLSHGAHFMDTTLQGILETALQPDDNDLYMSNLVSVPILGIHGGNDMNVPTWHSRQLYASLKAWYPEANISYHEEQGKPHWWDTVLSAPYVQSFLDKIVAFNTTLPSLFTLTTSITAESGSLHGFSIRQLELPGGLGRLRVESGPGPEVLVNTVNVWEFSVDVSHLKPQTVLIVDGTKIKIKKGDSMIWLSKAGDWHRERYPSPCRPSGPLNHILSGTGGIIIVVPKKSARYLSASTRIAHNLLAYLKIDSQILFDNEATKLLGKGRLGCSNIIIMGGHSNTFGQHIMSGNPGSVVFEKSGWNLRGRHFVSPGSGIAFLHSHPTCTSGLTLFMTGTDEAGLERILRILPFRTGLPVPEWVITSGETDTKGAGGLLGAGYWGRYWEWSDARSWIG